MKKFISFIFLFFVVSNLGASRSADFESLSNMYGNKSANLIELSNIVDDINRSLVPFQGAIEVAIPKFFAISHDAIKQCLATKNIAINEGDAPAPALNLLLRFWHEFQAEQREKNKLTLLGKQKLEAITQVINKAFEQPANFRGLDSRGKQEDVELNSWLQALIVHNPDALVMVRSTGREDSKEFANAGGNESVSAVKPDLISISEAMKAVLASYFGERSVEQRLLANDQSLFTSPEPFMPVLIQFMIGEKIGGEPNPQLIPSAGVLFTVEAEGKTPGVMQIDSAFGHNELVVLGLGKTDSFYVGPTEIIHPVIRNKTHRLVSIMQPDGKLKLEMKKNSLADKNIEKTPSLNQGDIFALVECGKAIQTHYDNEPMDVEFVVQRWLDGDLVKSSINIVQARPLVFEENNPSYLTEDFLRGKKIFELRAIGSAGGALQKIENPQAIIFGERGYDALMNFLRAPNHSDVKCVATGEFVPATSHAATTLRGNSKPFVFLPKSTFEVFAEMQKSPETFKPFFVDVQRQLFVDLGSAEPDIVDAAKLQGWLNHPIPRFISVMPQNFKFRLGKQIKDLLKPVNRFPDATLKDLLNILKTDDPEKRVRDKDHLLAVLQTIMHRLYKRVNLEINRQKKLDEAKHKTNYMLVDQLKNLLLQSQVCAKEILDIFEHARPGDEGLRMQKLYAVNFLEALIYQHPGADELVSGYSFGTVLKTEKIEQALLKELSHERPVSGEVAEYVVQFKKLKDYSFSPVLEQHLQVFTSRLVESGNLELTKKFANILGQVSELGILTQWLHTSLAKAFETLTPENLPGIIEALEREFLSNQEFIKTLKEKRDLIKGMNVAEWSNPDDKTFNKLKRNFTESLLNYFTSPEFILSLNLAYAQQNELTKAVAIGAMKDFVDLFDSSVKAISGSTEYGDNVVKKVGRFKEMIELYFSLLRSWIGIENIKYNNLDLLLNLSFESYIGIIWEWFRGIPLNEKQTQPSGNFDVERFSLGGMTKIDATLSQRPTFEDLFALIHQDLLAVLANLTGQTYLTGIQRPFSLARLEHCLEKFKQISKKKPRLIGVDLSVDMIKLKYNIPVREHSMTAEISYSKASKNNTFTVNFIKIRDESCIRLSYRSKILSVLSGLPEPTSLILGNNSSVAITWNFKDSDTNLLKMPSILNILYLIVTFYPSGDYLNEEKEFFESTRENVTRVKVSLVEFIKTTVIKQDKTLKNLVELDIALKYFLLTVNDYNEALQSLNDDLILYNVFMMTVHTSVAYDFGLYVIKWLINKNYDGWFSSFFSYVEKILYTEYYQYASEGFLGYIYSIFGAVLDDKILMRQDEVLDKFFKLVGSFINYKEYAKIRASDQNNMQKLVGRLVGECSRARWSILDLVDSGLRQPEANQHATQLCAAAYKSLIDCNFEPAFMHLVATHSNLLNDRERFYQKDKIDKKIILLKEVFIAMIQKLDELDSTSFLWGEFLNWLKSNISFLKAYEPQKKDVVIELLSAFAKKNPAGLEALFDREILLDLKDEFAQLVKFDKAPELRKFILNKFAAMTQEAIEQDLYNSYNFLYIVKQDPERYKAFVELLTARLNVKISETQEIRNVVFLLRNLNRFEFPVDNLNKLWIELIRELPKFDVQNLSLIADSLVPTTLLYEEFMKVLSDTLLKNEEFRGVVWAWVESIYRSNDWINSERSIVFSGRLKILTDLIRKLIGMNFEPAISLIERTISLDNADKSGVQEIWKIAIEHKILLIRFISLYFDLLNERVPEYLKTTQERKIANFERIFVVILQKIGESDSADSVWDDFSNLLKTKMLLLRTGKPVEKTFIIRCADIFAKKHIAQLEDIFSDALVADLKFYLSEYVQFDKTPELYSFISNKFFQKTLALIEEDLYKSSDFFNFFRQDSDKVNQVIDKLKEKIAPKIDQGREITEIVRYLMGLEGHTPNRNQDVLWRMLIEAIPNLSFDNVGIIVDAISEYNPNYEALKNALVEFYRINIKKHKDLPVGSAEKNAMLQEIKKFNAKYMAKKTSLFKQVQAIVNSTPQVAR